MSELTAQAGGGLYRRERVDVDLRAELEAGEDSQPRYELEVPVRARVQPRIQRNGALDFVQPSDCIAQERGRRGEAFLARLGEWSRVSIKSS